MFRKILFSLFIFTFCAGNTVWAGSGDSALGGFAGGMMGGLMSGAMTRSGSGGSSRHTMEAVRNLENAVKIDLMNLNSKISNLETRLNDINNKLNELSMKVSK